MRGFRHWRWHLDEMYVKLNGEMVYLWRAVDHEGQIANCVVGTPMAWAICASYDFTTVSWCGPFSRKDESEWQETGV